MQEIRRVRFTIIKDIIYVNPKVLYDKLKCLEQLKTEDFGKIKIPEYEFEQTGDLSLRIISEYIKGRYANNMDMRTIRQYAIERINKPESEYTLSYSANNWIVESKPPGNLYCIDLDSYRKMDINTRWNKWNNALEKHELYQKQFKLN